MFWLDKTQSVRFTITDTMEIFWLVTISAAFEKKFKSVVWMLEAIINNFNICKTLYQRVQFAWSSFRMEKENVFVRYYFMSEILDLFEKILSKLDKVWCWRSISIVNNTSNEFLMSLYFLDLFIPLISFLPNFAFVLSLNLVNSCLKH